MVNFVKNISLLALLGTSLSVAAVAHTETKPAADATSAPATTAAHEDKSVKEKVVDAAIATGETAKNVAKRAMVGIHEATKPSDSKDDANKENSKPTDNNEKKDDKTLGQKATDVKDAAKDKATDAKNAVKDAAHDAKNTATDVKDAAKDKATDVKNAVKDAAHDANKDKAATPAH